MEKEEFIFDDVQAIAYALERIRRKHKVTFSEKDFEHDCKIVIDYVNYEGGKRYPQNFVSYAVSHKFRLSLIPYLILTYTAIMAYYYENGLVELDKEETLDGYLEMEREWVINQYFERQKCKPLSKKELLFRLKCK